MGDKIKALLSSIGDSNEKSEPALDPSEGEVIRFKLCESDVVCDSVVVKIGLFAKKRKQTKADQYSLFWHKNRLA